YGGLLGGFLMALFVPNRGSDRSTALGMVVGSVAGLALFLQPLWLGRVAIAWTWWIALTAGLTVAVASTVPRRSTGSETLLGEDTGERPRRGHRG
ncbi:MAG: hypothetical protein ACPG77_01620, partial [Nannocystaceae bacterium]